MNDKKRILCYPLLAWMNLHRTLPSEYSHVMCVALHKAQHIELNFRMMLRCCVYTYTHAYEQPTPSQTLHHLYSVLYLIVRGSPRLT